MENMDSNRSESLCPVSSYRDEIQKQSRAHSMQQSEKKEQRNAPKQNDRHLALTTSGQLVICEFKVYPVFRSLHFPTVKLCISGLTHSLHQRKTSAENGKY